ncbi:MAG: hypothetical protein KC635_15315 [Myxococcales bacterium]|nr:hypothetical protein [Myxococcales bacterium]MCB9731833.1 hypothetical protein [Deltaproteobacteria bacterium]
MDPGLDSRIDHVLDTATDHAAVVRELLALVTEVVPAIGAYHYRYERDGLRGVRGSLDPLLGDVRFGLVAQPASDPCHLAATRLAPRPRVIHATRLLPRRAFERSAAYAEFYRDHDMDHIACLWLTGRAHGEVGFSGVVLPRAAADGDFRPDELAVLAHVLPTLVAATHADAEAAPEHLAGPDPGDGAARVAFDGDGRVTRLDEAAAEQLFRAGVDPTELVAMVLERLQSSPLWSDATPALRARSLVWSRRHLLLPHPTRRDTLEVRVVLTPGEPGGAVVLEPPGASVTARALVERGLTSAEICVLQALADGLDTAQIGEAMFISQETVRTHIKHLLRKLGVSSRVQAALLMQQLRFDEAPPRWR